MNNTEKKISAQGHKNSATSTNHNRPNNKPSTQTNKNNSPAKNSNTNRGIGHATSPEKNLKSQKLEELTTPKIQAKARYLEMSAKEKAAKAIKPVKPRLVGLLEGESNI
jgi:hypothetical protein